MEAKNSRGQFAWIRPGRPVRIRIVGGGKFGRRAWWTLKERAADADILLIEMNPEKCFVLEKEGIAVLQGDGISFMSEFISVSNSSSDWIVPAIPAHAAYLWVRLKLKDKFDVVSVEISQDIRFQLPHPMDGEFGQLFVSIADFFCPDDCPEPEIICTVTRKPKPYELYRHMETLKTDDITPVIIQSHQLAPGAGGYTPKALNDALNKIRQAHTGVLLGTACRCHGVVDAFRLEKRAGQ